LRLFGTVRSETGGQANDFKFTGQQLDSETAFYYLRARYYDPSTGRFLTRDPFGGFLVNPQTLNRYPYSVNDPINHIDPWGLCGFDGFGDFADCFTPENVGGGFKKGWGWISGGLGNVDPKNVVVGGTLIAAGTALAVGSVWVGGIILTAETAAAPATGGVSLILLPHTVGVVAFAGGFGAAVAVCGVEVMATGSCPHIFPQGDDDGEDSGYKRE
jgi:RHS repeat-associated protein